MMNGAANDYIYTQLHIGMKTRNNRKFFFGETKVVEIYSVFTSNKSTFLVSSAEWIYKNKSVKNRLDICIYSLDKISQNLFTIILFRL